MRTARKTGVRSLPTFEALRHREFRLLWLALLASAVGTWMQIVSLSLLVLRITHGSALALGAVSLAQAAAFFLFAFVGGGFADRFDKRRLLLVTQSLLALTAAALGTLTLTGHATLGAILALAFVSSAILSFDQPARSALVPLLVPREALTNAVALQSVAFSAASAVGPAIAGFLVGALGIAGNFYLNAASFAGMLLVLYVLRLPERARVRAPGRPLWASLQEALGVVRRDPALPWVIAGYGVLLFCGPSASLILPIYGQQVLKLQGGGLGWLFSALGLGTITGGLIVASLRGARHRGRVLLAAMALWVGALVAFGFARSLWPAMLALCVYGVALNGTQSSAIALMQGRVEDQLRGRIMSVNTLLMMGVRPLGDFPAGALVGVIGAPGVVWLGAAIVAVCGLFLGTRRALREV